VVLVVVQGHNRLGDGGLEGLWGVECMCGVGVEVAVVAAVGVRVAASWQRWTR
jgi:hypothetical protein